MTTIRLKRLLTQRQLGTALDHLLNQLPDAVRVEDAEGHALLGSAGRPEQRRHPVRLGEETLGYVIGETGAEALAALLSHLAAQELEKKALAQETLDRYKEVNLLYNLSEKINSTLDLKAIADLVLTEAQQLLAYPRPQSATPHYSGTLMLVNTYTQTLETLHSFGEEPINVALPVGRGIAGHVVVSGRPEIVNDVHQDPRFLPGPFPISSLMCAPLKAKDQVLGVICISSTQPVQFTASDLKRLTVLAAQAALAIGNAQLYANKLKEEQIRVSLDRSLGGRYRILRTLGSGGFGQTYLAEDSQQPGTPACVVKQLRPAGNNTQLLEIARRLFDAEAQALAQLGSHDQIPNLLAYFEQDNEFYLVQEFVEGELLRDELYRGQHRNEIEVIHLMREILEILAFVHANQVIHRDIKPENIIRRRRDQRLVLIDFGSVKQVRGDVMVHHTVAIGTRGYAPAEQYAGRPRYSSDLYAVGMIAVQALTGLSPTQLQLQPQNGQVDWRACTTPICPDLAALLDRMLHEQPRFRFPTAQEALEALQALPIAQTAFPNTAVEPRESHHTEIILDPPAEVVDWDKSPVLQGGRWLLDRAREIFHD
ncbi:MAG: GAF domain-containing protein [Gloeomargaritaceae cyanobacterium C42_A2020_066]|nr:GAF domain-containing protein [Gloeomargaritaceae cyanobacterium C42_A2020_066]